MLVRAQSKVHSIATGIESVQLYKDAESASRKFSPPFDRNSQEINKFALNEEYSLAVCQRQAFRRVS